MSPPIQFGDRYLFGGPDYLQTAMYGPVEYVCWRTDLATGTTETRPVPRGWTGDPREVFDGAAPDA